MARQPMPGGENQAALLGRRDAGGGTAKVGAGATAHLDKYRVRPVAADEIDLAALDAEVARQQRKSLRAQMPGGTFLGGGADLLARLRRGL